MFLDHPADDAPKHCDLCNGWVDAHDYYCPYREEMG